MLAEIGHGVEVQIERLADEEVLSGELAVPAVEQARDLLWGDARGIFRHEALLRHGVEAAEQGEPLVIEPTRQRGEAFLRENLAHRGGAQGCSLLLERPADLVDRVVALAQRDDLLMSAALLGLLARTRMRGGEELRQGAAAKIVAQ